jgi:hypothetical protein
VQGRCLLGRAGNPTPARSRHTADVPWVILSTGVVHNYRWGAAKKRKLLTLESALAKAVLVAAA